MKYLCVFAAACFMMACTQQDKKTGNVSTSDTTGLNKSQPVTPKDSTKIDSPAADFQDTVLMQLSNQILKVIKEKDFTGLTSFIHPKWGVRFSSYAYIDTQNSQLLSAAQLISFAKEKKILNWGLYDGSGKKIKMTISNYFDKFVYDKDFLNAEKKSVNKFLEGGNSLNNLKEIYPEADFTEFYFPGFDPKYNGMDWRTLRLVFQTENNKPYLVAVIHDEWTI